MFPWCYKHNIFTSLGNMVTSWHGNIFYIIGPWYIIMKLFVQNSSLDTVRWMPWNVIHDTLTLVKVIAWSSQDKTVATANVDPDICRHTASPGHNEWKRCIFYKKQFRVNKVVHRKSDNHSGFKFAKHVISDIDSISYEHRDTFFKVRILFATLIPVIVCNSYYVMMNVLLKIPLPIWRRPFPNAFHVKQCVSFIRISIRFVANNFINQVNYWHYIGNKRLPD